jgi:hypothetical protein
MTSRPPRPPLDPDAYRRLPEPVDLDETITSADADPPPNDPDDGIDGWLLKNAAG